MSSPSSFPPLFLIPALSGVRSRRHLVTMRRAEGHVKEVKEILVAAAEANVDILNDADDEKFRSKMKLVQQAWWELDTYVEGHPQTRIRTRFEVINKELVHLLNFQLSQDAARAKAAQA